MSINDIRIGDVRTFVRIVESRGMTAASRVLRISPKQVSRQLLRLEDAVGQRLLHRTTHSVSLTPAGRRFLNHATRLIDESDRAAHFLEVPDHGVVEELRVVVPELDSGITTRIATLKQQFPNAAFHVTLSDAPIDLARGGHDLQIVIGTPSQTTFHIRRLATIRGVLAAHRSYVDRHGAPGVPEDLTHHNALLWTATEAQDTWTLARDGEDRVVPVHGDVRSNHSGVLFAALHAGLGIGPIGEGRFERERGDLVHLLPGWTFQTSPVNAIFPGAGHRSPLVEAFLALAKASIEHDYGARGSR